MAHRYDIVLSRHDRRISTRRLLVVLFALTLGSGCDQLAGPQAMVANALDAASQPGVRFVVDDCGALTIVKAHFSRLLVKPEGKGMVAVATIDAEAMIADGIQVSYLGLERTPFRLEGMQWKLDGPLFPALHEALSLMCRRRKAIAGGDVNLLRALGFEPVDTALIEARVTTNEAPDVRRWVLRIEREGAEVLEEGGKRNNRFLLKRENGSFRPAPAVF